MNNHFVKLVSCLVGCVILIAVASRRSGVVNDLRGAIRRTLQYGDFEKEYVPGSIGDNGTNIWWTYDQTKVCNTEWIDYYEEEIPRDTDEGGDEIDVLYDHDVCYKGGTYSHDNCPEPPDCDLQSENAVWDLKLCLNRMPIPDDDDDTYYVKVMKCIPVWENCDKCMCGRVGSSDPTRCKTQDDCDPDDDRLNLLCDEDAILRFASYLVTPFGVCDDMPNDKEKVHIPEKFTPILDFTIPPDKESEAPDDRDESDENDEGQTEDENSDEQDEDQTEDEDENETEDGQTEDEKSDETNVDQTEDDASEGVTTDVGNEGDDEKFVSVIERTKSVASVAESFNNN